MADEKNKQPRGGEDKPKPRSRSAASKQPSKPKAGAAKGESKAAAAGGSRTRKMKDDAPKKDDAAQQGARKPAAKADAKTGAKSQPKAEPKAETKPAPKAETKPTKAPARSRGAAKKESKRPAAPRRGAGRSEPVSRPVVRAQAKYVRSSARKARLVMDHVRGKSVSDARALLRHSPRGVARDLERLLASAVANAENNHELVGDDLYVKEIYADEGPTLKRFRPRAQGRATRIRKRTSHLTVALSTKE